MDSESFERAIVDTLTAIIAAKEKKNDPVATEAWPYKKAAGRAWQAIRSNATAQRLTIRDAHAMAKTLGLSMSQLCALVESQEFGGLFPKEPAPETRQAPVKTLPGSAKTPALNIGEV